MYKNKGLLLIYTWDLSRFVGQPQAGNVWNSMNAKQSIAEMKVTNLQFLCWISKGYKIEN